MPRRSGTLEINEECLVAEICIDRYLWALYERAPKIDAIKVHERRKVKVKRKGKMVTVTKTFTRRVDEEFGWKDPKAAEKFGMTMMDYVIGGMDRSFKLKLFHTLYAAEQAGLSPGITSAFRDDYRQSIASGLKVELPVDPNQLIGTQPAVAPSKQVFGSAASRVSRTRELSV